MKRFPINGTLMCLICLFFLTTACSPSRSSTPAGASDTVPIRDAEGVTMTPEELAARLATGEWTAEPLHDENGEVVEIVVFPTQGRPTDMEMPPGAMMIDGGTPIRNEKGETVSFEEFMSLMDEGGWRPEPVLDEAGNVAEIVMVKDDSARPLEGPVPGGDVFSESLGKGWLGETLPELDLTTLEGKKISPSDLDGKIVVINLWFRGCKPCLMEIPELNDLVKEFESEDVIFLAPTFDSEDEVRTVLGVQPFDYEIVPNAQAVHEEFGIRTFPAHLIFDRNQRCVIAHSGFSPGIGRMLKGQIQEALEQKP